MRAVDRSPASRPPAVATYGAGSMPASGRSGVGLGTWWRVCLVVLVPVTQISASTPAEASSSGCTQADPVAGCQGMVQPLPATSSQVTVDGQGQYANLQVTVNQTQNLTNQAVSVSWTGGSHDVSNQPGDSLRRQLPPDLPVLGRSQSSDPSGPVIRATALPVRVRRREQPHRRLPGDRTSGFEYSRGADPARLEHLLAVDPAVHRRPGTDTEPCLDANGLVAALRGGGRHRRQAAGRLQLPRQPATPRCTSGSIPTSASPPPTRSTSPAPTRTAPGNQLFQVDTGLEAPGLGLRAERPGAGRRRHHHPPVLAGRRPAEHADGREPDRSRPTQRGHLAAHPRGMGQPDRHPVEVQPGRLQLLDQRQVATDHRQRAGRSRPWPAGSRRCAACPARRRSAISRTTTTRPARTSPTRLRLGGDVGVLRSDPQQCRSAPPTPVVYAPLTLSGVVIAFNIERVPALQSGRHPASRTSWPRTGRGWRTSTSPLAWWPSS